MIRKHHSTDNVFVRYARIPWYASRMDCNDYAESGYSDRGRIILQWALMSFVAAGAIAIAAICVSRLANGASSIAMPL